MKITALTRSEEQLARRDLASARCARHVGEMQRRRIEKRAEALTKRSGSYSSVTITTESPYYPTIQNDTCILTPEITTGPYIWTKSQTLRQDMTEGQPGIPLILDVGVIDINTCEPMRNVLVDLWHCNATGSYSSFTGRNPQHAELNVTIDENFDIHTDDTTFLRGMWPTDANGVMEMKTIVPGFYVHQNWVLQPNGTILTDTTANTGQFFIADDITEYLMSYEPYVSHTEIERTTNAVDSIYSSETVNGWSPELAVIPMDGEDYANGIIGYITMGVDSTRWNASSF
ncbi:protocatechuate 3,4-dioxygenase beta subunit [Desarmillaria tabescens]|uniref:Protocatechuate 3,4-dioxygenase beta subunit n=1 Tax=Armillaria tabescens TaxID=1929756 RepID=A0AA39NCF3_ARMTA|nr:protocatechuate 3,4-dioxygenase beta subunit [Desarmillaria tabescens]KAK0462979.1 protocatechuate 3,4-dioxygenase beta subunit [Desarmillaria tabescens]